MVFWIAAGFLGLVVAGLVLLAARRPRAADAPAAAYDLRVYRDQLRELDRDVARGTLSEAEAARARTEVSRRILEADRALKAASTTGARGAQIPLLALALVAVIGGAAWLYTRIGAPGYPDLPLAGRIEMIETARGNRPTQALAEEQTSERPVPAVDPRRVELVEQLREVLETRPDDTEGLTLLAANEAMLGNFRAAHRAQAHLIELLGDAATGRHYIDYAEMLIFAAGGYVSPEAEAALRRGLELQPRDGTGRYYAGEMYAQQGRPDLALPIWLDLLRESRPEAPWVDPIRSRIGELAFAAGVEIDPSLAAPRGGPTPEQIAAMQGLDSGEQTEMIEGMVAGLADRLATEGGPPEDWAQLITAYGVLGRTEAAQIVFDDAMATFSDAPEALAMIDAAFRAAMARAGGE